MSFGKLTGMYGVMRRQGGCRNWFYSVLRTEDTSMFHNLALMVIYLFFYLQLCF
jgi:hypothetical protein